MNKNPYEAPLAAQLIDETPSRFEARLNKLEKQVRRCGPTADLAMMLSIFSAALSVIALAVLFLLSYGSY